MDTAAASVSITGLKALEIGSGRGGGAAFVNKYYKPEMMVGLDYSPYAVDLATNIAQRGAKPQFYPRRC